MRYYTKKLLRWTFCSFARRGDEGNKVWNFVGDEEIYASVRDLSCFIHEKHTFAGESEVFAFANE